MVSRSSSSSLGHRVRFVLVALVALALLFCFRSRPVGAGANPMLPEAQGSDGYSYFPTGDTQDCRFLALAGLKEATVSGSSVDVKLAAPGMDGSFEVALFDGDMGGAWDTVSTVTTTCYELYANPNNGSLTNSAGNLNPGVVLLNSWSSAQMADNAWSTLADNGTVSATAGPALTNNPLAQATSGNYYYILHCYLVDASATAINAFRVRTRTPMGVAPSNYGIYAPWNQTAVEEKTYYPNWDSSQTPANQTDANLAGTRYDGTWTFYLDVPSPQTSLGIWDGDFDHGGQNSYINLLGQRMLGGGATTGDWDTHDADTQGYLNSTLAPGYSGPVQYVAQDITTQPFLTWWHLNTPTSPASLPLNYPTAPTMRVPGFAANNLSVLEEGVGIGTVQNAAGVLIGFHTGDPPDDTALVTGTGAPAANKVLVRQPAVQYNLIDPYGNCYYNGNPSGNLEWERFTVTSDPSQDWHLADYGPGWGTSTGAGNDASMNGAQVIPQATPGIAPGPLGLPGGVWTISISGLDIHNLDAIYPDFDTLGESLDGKPIAGIRPFNLSGHILSNCSGTPVSGVKLTLLDQGGSPMLTTTTLADGRYLFWVNPGTYTVVIDPANFQAGGALYQWGSTATGTSAQVAIAGANGSRDFQFLPPATVSAPATASFVNEPGTCGVSKSRLAQPAVNCSVTNVTNDAPAVLPVGTTVVTWSATDAAGNTATAVQTVTVTDTEKPTLSGPATVTVSTDAGSCVTSAANLPAPTVNDNCAGVTLANNAPATLTGTTTIIWTATDPAGNSASFSQTVTVTDQVPPTIQCPPDVTVGADSGKATASGVALGAPVTADNCGVASVTNNAPATFPAGKTVVTWTVTDTSGNTATCNQNVTVNAPGGLSGFAYTDLNGNSSYQPGTDQPLAGVTITLSGASTASTTTGADGSYSFSGLSAGSYTVTATNSAGGQALWTANPLTVSVPAAQTVTNNNFGYGLGAISGTTYTDSDQDSTYTAGTDSPLSGVTVSLSGTDVNGNAVATSVAVASDGSYSFPNLVAGSYTVTVPTTAGGAAIETGSPLSVDLAAGEANPGNDFGYILGSVTGMAFLDKNKNGRCDGNESALGGVKLSLSGPTAASATTATDGSYCFSGLKAGSYTVTSATTASGHAVEAPNPVTVTVPPGTTVPDNNFGYAPGSISGIAFTDVNNNGTYEAGTDTLLPGVLVTLGGASSATLTTGTDGSYSFTGLAAGNYTVTVPATVGKQNLKTTASISVALSAGANRTNVNFGYAAVVVNPAKGSIGGTVFTDSDGSGAYTSGDAVLKGVTVTLSGKDSSGKSVSLTTVTATDGSYLFPNLSAGSYVVSAPTTVSPQSISTASSISVALTAGQVKTGVNFGYRFPAGKGSIGGKVCVNSAGSSTSGGYGGDDDRDDGDDGEHCGDRSGGSTIHGRVCRQDDDDNDSQDNSWNRRRCHGMRGVKVTLGWNLDSRGNPRSTYTCTTDWSGGYCFNRVPTGKCVILVDKTTLPLYNGKSLNPVWDCDGASTPHQACHSHGYNDDCSSDFVYKCGSSSGSSSGCACNGAAGVKVTLKGDLSGDGNADIILTTTTDANGSYNFPNLAAGKYTVTVDPAGLPKVGSVTVVPVSDFDGIGTPNTATLSLASSQSNSSVNFSYEAPTGCQGGRVYSCAGGDNDGTDGGNRSRCAFAGVKVNLTGRDDCGNTVSRSCVTDSTGAYQFTGLLGGSYTCTIDPTSLPKDYRGRQSQPVWDCDGVSTAHQATGVLQPSQSRSDCNFRYSYCGVGGH